MSDSTIKLTKIEQVARGKKGLVLLPMPELYDWTPMYMPVHVVKGKQEGPTLCITAAIHGDEINGTEIIRRVLKKISLKKLCGTIIAVPIVNVYGFIYQQRGLMDRRDLNRSFPGSRKGSIAARLAHLIVRDIVPQATHIIDLHTGSHHRYNLPQIRANLDVPEVSALAKSFNVPVIMHATLRDGSFRHYASEKGIPFLLYEAGEALRFDELSIKTGVNGILSTMHYLEMLPPGKRKIKKMIPAITRASYWLRAPLAGLLKPLIKIGQKVNVGQQLALIVNPTTAEEYPLLSTLDGIVIGESKIPLVHEGAALYHIACFEKLSLVEEQVEYLHEEYNDE